MKKGFKGNLDKLTLANDLFRHVIYTSSQIQLVVMSLKPGEEIGVETHNNGDQFFRFEDGEGKVIINEAEYEVVSGDGIIVPAGAKHNVINTSRDMSLKLYTIYAPPHHKDGILRNTKEEAVTNAPEYDGITTE